MLAQLTDDRDSLNLALMITQDHITSRMDHRLEIWGRSQGMYWTRRLEVLVLLRLRKMMLLRSCRETCHK
jgi:hypothetical protein